LDAPGFFVIHQWRDLRPAWFFVIHRERDLRRARLFVIHQERGFETRCSTIFVLDN
jgi:hypothetical protein